MLIIITSAQILKQKQPDGEGWCGLQLVQDRASADWLILFHVARTDFSYNGVGVARGAGPAGPFTYQGSFLPNDWASYDMNIFEDVDGAYYLARSLGNTPKIAVSRLAPDFMSVEAACNFYTEAKVLPCETCAV